jgi:hypothetical protein
MNNRGHFVTRFRQPTLWVWVSRFHQNDIVEIVIWPKFNQFFILFYRNVYKWRRNTKRNGTQQNHSKQIHTQHWYSKHHGLNCDTQHIYTQHLYTQHYWLNYDIHQNAFFLSLSASGGILTLDLRIVNWVLYYYTPESQITVLYKFSSYYTKRH